MEQKERISITIDKKLLRWIDEKIDARIFANRSHGLEFLVKWKIKSDNSVMPGIYTASGESEK